MFEVGIEVLFNREGFVSGLCVVGSEAFGEDVGALVMLVFEAALSEDLVNVMNLNDFISVFLEVIPNGVVFWGSGVDADDFSNEGFPSVGPVVHTVVQGFVAVRTVSGVVTGADDLT